MSRSQGGGRRRWKQQEAGAGAQSHSHWHSSLADLSLAHIKVRPQVSQGATRPAPPVWRHGPNQERNKSDQGGGDHSPGEGGAGNCPDGRPDSCQVHFSSRFARNTNTGASRVQVGTPCDCYHFSIAGRLWDCTRPPSDSDMLAPAATRDASSARPHGTRCLSLPSSPSFVRSMRGCEALQ